MRLLRAALPALAVGLAACSSTSEPSPPPVLGTKATPHIRRPADTDPAPPPIESLEFLVGRWEGEAFGGWVEETWGPVEGGAMLGSFRLVTDGEPNFYELILIVTVDDRPTMRVKHFAADMTPWEEGAESVDFPLIAVEGTTAWFDGLTWKLDGDDLLGYVSMTSGGKQSEAEFRLRRAR